MTFTDSSGHVHTHVHLRATFHSIVLMNGLILTLYSVDTDQFPLNKKMGP